MRSTIRILGLISALLLASVAVWSRIPTASQNRLLRFIDGDSSSVRYEAWQFTWGVVDGRIIGQGWSSWALQTTGPLRHPHNLLFEVWFEAGLLALIAMLTILLMTGRHQVRLFMADRFRATLGLGVLVYWFAAGLVSGDFNDNKTFFMVLIAAAAPSVLRRETPEAFDSDVYQPELDPRSVESNPLVELDKPFGL